MKEIKEDMEEREREGDKKRQRGRDERRREGAEREEDVGRERRMEESSSILPPLAHMRPRDRVRERGS